MRPPRAVAARPPSSTGDRRLGRMVRIVVYVLLVVSAGVTVLFGDRLWTAMAEGRLPSWVPLVAPGAMTLLVCVYAVDRWLLVTRHHYPITRAFFQVAFAFVFLTLLLPQQAAEWRQTRQADTSTQERATLWLLAHPEAPVRIAVCELLTGSVTGKVLEHVATAASLDADAKVRQSCSQSLERLHLL